MSADVQSRFVEPQPQLGWPMNRVDLHCHTNRSDGVLPPEALLDAMAEWGLHVAAISDHDLPIMASLVPFLMFELPSAAQSKTWRNM